MIKVVGYLTVFLLMPQLVSACQQCFGANVNTATTQGIGFAMLALLGITGFVSTGIIMFFLNMKKRSKAFSLKSETLDSNESKSEIMNQLLDKINEQGYGRLSRQEKELLKKATDGVEG